MTRRQIERDREKEGRQREGVPGFYLPIEVFILASIDVIVSHRCCN